MRRYINRRRFLIVVEEVPKGSPDCWCVEHVRSPGGGSPLYNLMEVKYKRIARAMAARLGLKEARSKSRGLMHKNRMRQLGADERTNDRKVHIHQASKL